MLLAARELRQLTRMVRGLLAVNDVALRNFVGFNPGNGKY